MWLFLVGLCSGVGVGWWWHHVQQHKALGSLIHVRDAHYNHVQREELYRRILESRQQYHSEVVHHSLLLQKLSKPLLHDLNNPLMSLEAGIVMLKQKASSTVQKKTLSQLHHVILHVQRVLVDARNILSNQQEKTDFRVYPTTQEVMTLLKSEFMHHEITWQVTGTKSMKLRGSRALFERILINLLINSAEELQTLLPDQPRMITVRLRVGTKQSQVIVSDTGRGIPDDSAKNVFQEGATSKEGHFGIGLSFVKESMSTHFMGDIQIRQTKTGSEVRLRFPTPRLQTIVTKM